MSRSDAENWLQSAERNFKSIRSRVKSADPCSLIEHYTDVVAEATVAEACATQIEDNVPKAIADRATKLMRTATRAQRGAVKACRLGVRPKKRG